MKKVALSFVFLLCCAVAAALNAPQLRCLNVDNAGDVTLSWLAPAETSGFVRYDIFFATSRTAPFTRITQIADLSTLTFTHTSADANNSPQCFYYVAACSNTSSYASDTLCTIELYLSNQGGGTAVLTWSAPTAPALPTFAPIYNICRNFQNVWDEVGTSSQLLYRDVVDVCDATLGYRVELADESGCRNVSRTLHDLFADNTPPDIPQLDSVSVDFATSQIRLGWEESMASDAAAYIIYHFENGLWIPADTVFGIHNTTWVDPVNSATEPQQYRIAALDSCQNSSPMSEPQHNIRVTSTHDLCLRQATLAWEEYENMPMEVELYRIWFSENGGPLTLAGEVSGQTFTFTLHNLTPQSTYRCIVQAVNFGGNVTATSTRCTFLFNSADNADFCYIRYVSVVDNLKIEVKVSTGTTVSFAKVHLYRSVGDDQHFVHIAELTNNGTDTYLFEDEDVKVDRMHYYYRAAVENDCAVESARSQVAHNIILRGSRDPEARTSRLDWDVYEEWDGGVSGYSIFRKTEDSPTYDNIAPFCADTTYRDDVTELRKSGAKFAYFVEAEEAFDSYGFMERSRSNVIELEQLPQTYIPNAFCPRPGGENSVFKPVNSYVTMENYHMRIFTREGVLVFHTTDPNQGWNGGYNGNLMPPGCYVYVISYTYGTDGEYEATGTVTLVR